MYLNPVEGELQGSNDTLDGREPRPKAGVLPNPRKWLQLCAPRLSLFSYWNP